MSSVDCALSAAINCRAAVLFKETTLQDIFTPSPSRQQGKSKSTQAQVVFEPSPTAHRSSARARSSCTLQQTAPPRARRQRRLRRGSTRALFTGRIYLIAQASSRPPVPRSRGGKTVWCAASRKKLRPRDVRQDRERFGHVRSVALATVSRACVTGPGVSSPIGSRRRRGEVHQHA